MVVNSISAKVDFRIDILKFGNTLYEEIYTKEDDIDLVPKLLNHIKPIDGVFDPTKINRNTCCDAAEYVMVYELETGCSADLSVLRCYFPKHDNVSNYIVFRAREVIASMRSDRSVKFNTTMVGRVLTIIKKECNYVKS